MLKNYMLELKLAWQIPSKLLVVHLQVPYMCCWTAIDKLICCITLPCAGLYVLCMGWFISWVLHVLSSYFLLIKKLSRDAIESAGTTQQYKMPEGHVRKFSFPCYDYVLDLFTQNPLQVIDQNHADVLNLYGFIVTITTTILVQQSDDSVVLNKSE